MNDEIFYKNLSALWPSMISAIKSPEDAIAIGQIGIEIRERTKRLETEAVEEAKK